MNNATKGNMRTQTTLALLGAMGLLAGVACAQPAPDDAAAPSAPEGRPGAGRPDPEMHRKMLTEKYDANKDGKLDDAEFAALGKDLWEGRLRPPMAPGRPGPEGQRGTPGTRDFHRGKGPEGSERALPPRPRAPGFEGRGQPGLPPERAGSYAPEEREGAPRRPLAMNREGSPPRSEFGNAPRGRSSEMARKPLETHRKEFLKKYDANGDGKLDAPEREAIGRDIEEGKLPPPPLAPPQAPGEPQAPRAPR